jgi:hypothetical protein
MDITKDPELSLDVITPNVIIIDTLIDLLKAREYALKVWCAYWRYVYKAYKNILEKPWEKQYTKKSKKYCELLTIQGKGIRDLNRSLNSWNLRRVRSANHIELLQRVIELCEGVFMFVIPEAFRVFNPF